MIHGSMVHDITLVWLTEGAGDPFSMSQRKLFKATAARSSYKMQKCVQEFVRSYVSEDGYDVLIS